MATVKYLLQSENSSAAIYCRLSMGRGKVAKRKTGFSINPKEWSTKKGLPIARDPATKQLKSDLSKLANEVLEKFNQAQAEGKTLNGQWLQTAIDTHFNRREPEQLDYLTNYVAKVIENIPYRITGNGKMGVRPSTLKTYNGIYKKLREFEAYKGKRYLLSEVDDHFRKELIKYFKAEDGLSENTIGRLIKRVKSFLADAQKNGYQVSPQINNFKGFTVKVSKITLSFNELQQIENCTFENETLEAAKDWLIIACFTGQRVSDLLRMNTGMISHYNKYPFITLTQIKTGKTVNIPVHFKVRPILEKRGGHFPKTFAAQTESNHVLFNRYVKKVCRLAGIDEPAEGKVYDKEAERYLPGTYPKWRLVSSHIGRRSFATNFYANPKYPTPLLMNITGHSNEKVFLEYIGKQPMDYGLQMAQIWAEEAQKPQAEPKLRVIRTGNGWAYFNYRE